MIANASLICPECGLSTHTLVGPIQGDMVCKPCLRAFEFERAERRDAWIINVVGFLSCIPAALLLAYCAK